MKIPIFPKIFSPRNSGVPPLVTLTFGCLFFAMTACSSAQPPKPASASTAPVSAQQQPAILTQKMAVDSPVLQKPSPQKQTRQKAKKTAPQIDKTLLASIDSQWLPLIVQLKEDLPNLPIEEYFVELPTSSGKTMAKKIHELHHYNYVVKPSKKKDDEKKIIPEYEKSSVYAQFVTQTGMKKSNAFLNEYKAAFDFAEERYQVPREIVAALLYVETQHGSYLGKTKAFWSLASMAASTTPESIQADLTVTILPDQKTWLQEKLDEKSLWAYREVKALLTHCERNNLDPRAIIGSEYGAIGICQFMPTNLEAYTDDGDGDGIIDLFNPNDAIVSTAKFLAVHNWAKAEDIAAQRRVIMRYNISSRYANTVLALAESLETGSLKKAQADAPSRQKEGKSVAATVGETTPEGKEPVEQAKSDTASVQTESQETTKEGKAEASGETVKTETATPSASSETTPNASTKAKGE